MCNNFEIYRKVLGKIYTFFRSHHHQLENFTVGIFHPFKVSGKRICILCIAYFVEHYAILYFEEENSSNGKCFFENLFQLATFYKIGCVVQFIRDMLNGMKYKTLIKKYIHVSQFIRIIFLTEVRCFSSAFMSYSTRGELSPVYCSRLQFNILGV